MRASAVTVAAALAAGGLVASGVAPVSAQAAPECFGRHATIVGTGDHDELVGTNGDDVIVALAGRDAIDARGGDDLICAGAGLDGYWKLVRGGGGHDRISGGGGRDEILGGPGRDTLFGGFEPDKLSGGGGADRLFGGHDNDDLSGGPADDLLHGGPDFEGDIVRFPNAHELRVDLGAGLATGSTGRDRLVDVEHAEGSKWSDVMIGDDGPNYLSSVYDYDDETEVRDVFRGLGGDDFIRPDDVDATVLVLAGAGADYVSGEGGGRYFGGPGNDWIEVYYAQAPVTADGGRGNDRVSAYDVELRLTGGPGDDGVWGGDKDDKLFGGPGHDDVGGGGGDDTIGGGAGDDELYGNKGRDRLDGGDGNDACADAAKYVSCEKEE